MHPLQSQMPFAHGHPGTPGVIALEQDSRVCAAPRDPKSSAWLLLQETAEGLLAGPNEAARRPEDQPTVMADRAEVTIVNGQAWALRPDHIAGLLAQAAPRGDHCRPGRRRPIQPGLPPSRIPDSGPANRLPWPKPLGQARWGNPRSPRTYRRMAMPQARRRPPRQVASRSRSKRRRRFSASAGPSPTRPSVAVRSPPSASAVESSFSESHWIVL